MIEVGGAKKGAERHLILQYARDAAVQGMMPESLDEIMDAIRKQRCSSVQVGGVKGGGA